MAHARAQALLCLIACIRIRTIPMAQGAIHLTGTIGHEDAARITLDAMVSVGDACSHMLPTDGGALRAGVGSSAAWNGCQVLLGTLQDILGEDLVRMRVGQHLQMIAHHRYYKWSSVMWLQGTQQ